MIYQHGGNSRSATETWGGRHGEPRGREGSRGDPEMAVSIDGGVLFVAVFSPTIGGLFRP